MRPPSRRERIAAQLADLKMPGALEALDDVLAGFDGGKQTAAGAIERLLAAQIALRNSRRLEAAMRSSRLPYVRTLENFDFSFQPSIKREQIDALHELGFLERRENVVFLGPPGVGKTHLAISLAITAAENGRKIYFGTLTDLVDSLEEAKAAGRLNRRLKTLTHPPLLIVDEISYLPVTQSGAVLFFQLVNRRYGHASTVLSAQYLHERGREATGEPGDAQGQGPGRAIPTGHFVLGAVERFTVSRSLLVFFTASCTGNVASRTCPSLPDGNSIQRSPWVSSPSSARWRPQAHTGLEAFPPAACGAATAVERLERARQ